jgi:hypothetical protein
MIYWLVISFYFFKHLSINDFYNKNKDGTLKLGFER